MKKYAQIGLVVSFLLALLAIWVPDESIELIENIALTAIAFGFVSSLVLIVGGRL